MRSRLPRLVGGSAAKRTLTLAQAAKETSVGEIELVCDVTCRQTSKDEWDGSAQNKVRDTKRSFAKSAVTGSGVQIAVGMRQKAGRARRVPR